MGNAFDGAAAGVASMAQDAERFVTSAPTTMLDATGSELGVAVTAGPRDASAAFASFGVVPAS
ncbi:MAG: hypothetical protein KF764_00465 [Labilithrix sp.]|nr:hypothetical protein [Labilithrix sp.]